MGGNAFVYATWVFCWHWYYVQNMYQVLITTSLTTYCILTCILFCLYSHRAFTNKPPYHNHWSRCWGQEYLTPIQEAVQHYFKHGLALSTLRCYNTIQQRYLFNFAHKVYLSSIGNWHSSCSQHNVYQKALTSRLEQVLRGIKKEQVITYPPQVPLPITTEIMTRIFSVLQQFPNDYQSIMLWAACCTTFFGFFK